MDRLAFFDQVGKDLALYAEPLAAFFNSLTDNGMNRREALRLVRDWQSNSYDYQIHKEHGCFSDTNGCRVNSWVEEEISHDED